ncbi:ankyrin repeat and fibronectin type-III domain-containing protein 1-like isoform X2 [Genypterus blacodes]|uniref:ankyrin repeat and fibronectin type-III domain-containing protein 1-like isoform X2 n=1 Tax=Genypterus blacodes TaxID=154954 RepID=UPI003F7675BC
MEILERRETDRTSEDNQTEGPVVLEMLSYSKLSDLEAWLCMPSTLLLPRGSSPHTSTHSSSSSSCSHSEDADSSLRQDVSFLTPALGKETPFLATPLLPLLSSTPPTTLTSVTLLGDSAPGGGVSVRKRRRVAASPGGLHWNSAGSLHRDFWSPDPSPEYGRNSAGEGAGQRRLRVSDGGGASGSEWAALRKTISVDDRLLQPAAAEKRDLRLKIRNVHSVGTTRYDGRRR